MHFPRSSFAIVALCIAASACSGTAPAFGSTAEQAEANAQAFFGGLGDRFNNVVRHPKYNEARLKLAHHALAPTKVFEDTSIWTAVRGSERVLHVDAGRETDRYFIKPAAGDGHPRRPGDARHTMKLRRVGEDEYRWTTSVDFGIGQVRAAEFAEVFAAMLAGAAGGRTESQARVDYRSAFPRGSAAMGRLFSIDTLRPIPLADGTSIVHFVTRIHASRIQKDFPHFAAYLEKYIKPARYDFTLVDRRGARWMEMEAEKYVIRFRLRASRDGRLAPLDGAGRPFPDDLYLRGEAFAKVMIFNVGVTDLIADVKWLHGPNERGWLLRFRKPPEWHLPPLVATMLKSPLRRPFENGGFTFRIAVRDSAPAQTVIARDIDGVVHESAILRWISGLSGTAMSDYVGPAEADENRFVMEAFYGLRSDYGALFDRARSSSATGPAEAR
jgi:hypothetical protein